MRVEVIRKDSLFSPDPGRIIPRFTYTTERRSIEILNTVLAFTEEEVSATMKQLLRGFSTRHRNITRIFEKHFSKLGHLCSALNIDEKKLSFSRKALIGSCFTHEYSIESAAFYNPSLVEHPDQSGLLPKEKRVIFSFRATGEGHISSIVFRTGVLDCDDNLIMEPVGRMLAEADVIKRNIYNRKDFLQQLSAIQPKENFILTSRWLRNLGKSFTYSELMQCMKEEQEKHAIPDKVLSSQIMGLASSQYEIDFSIDSAISERVIFPFSSAGQKGIEDARFVKFTEDDGEITYYATYNANNGTSLVPKLIKTTDFYHFKVIPMYGEIAGNTGMALFPRKINGRYAMLCRIDDVNNYISYSDNINIWHDAELIQKPRYPWEILQIGNAGSPIETEQGWLVITLAVGPMGKCVISASLFDLHDPARETGRLSDPLILPDKTEREGYVPNVIFSCGSIIHNESLIIPYSMSDHTSSYATVNLKELMNELKEVGKVTDESDIHFDDTNNERFNNVLKVA
jgi:predicted GH43/DUF377 family glycosyl hydrolase